MINIVEFLHKPVELFGKYEATTGGTPTAVTTASSVTSLKVDEYGRLLVTGCSTINSSTLGVNPILIAGVNTAGSITVLNTTSGTIKVDTEMILATDNITINNVKSWIDSVGTIAFALVDTSSRPVISPTSTIQTSLTSTVQIPVTSTVNFPASSTVQISATSTINTSNTSTVNIPTTSTVNFPASSTVQISTTSSIAFATTSTVNFPATSTVQISATSSIQPGGTQDIYIKAIYYSGTQLFTSTVVAASGTINSGIIDISKYEIKTVSIYVTAGNNNSTLRIDVSPTASGTINTYYVNNIASTSFTTKSFTEAFSDIRVQLIASTINSTIDAWLGLMA